jgi:hypothetical protein
LMRGSPDTSPPPSSSSSSISCKNVAINIWITSVDAKRCLLL